MTSIVPLNSHTHGHRHQRYSTDGETVKCTGGRDSPRMRVGRGNSLAVSHAAACLIITLPAPRLGIPCLGAPSLCQGELARWGDPLSLSSAPYPGASESLAPTITSTHRRVCLFLPISSGRKLSQEKDKEKRKEGEASVEPGLLPPTHTAEE